MIYLYYYSSHNETRISLGFYLAARTGSSLWNKLSDCLIPSVPDKANLLSQNLVVRFITTLKFIAPGPGIVVNFCWRQESVFCPLRVSEKTCALLEKIRG